MTRRGSSNGLSLRVARGLHYRPSTFRGRVVEKEETVHQDTGLFGFTTKPQTFRTGGGWFAYNLAVNLARWNSLHATKSGAPLEAY